MAIRLLSMSAGAPVPYQIELDRNFSGGVFLRLLRHNTSPEHPNGCKGRLLSIGFRFGGSR
eukprot:scaffold126557_cov76-Cyclotella_meneghiniana.AAC.2